MAALSLLYGNRSGYFSDDIASIPNKSKLHSTPNRHNSVHTIWCIGQDQFPENIPVQADIRNRLQFPCAYWQDLSYIGDGALIKITTVTYVLQNHPAQRPDLHPYQSAIWAHCQRALILRGKLAECQELIDGCDRRNIVLPDFLIQRTPKGLLRGLHISAKPAYDARRRACVLIS